MITYMTGFIILFSLVYYFFVFTSEVFGFTPAWVKKLFGNHRRNGFSSFYGRHSINDDKVTLNMNPIKGDSMTRKRLEELEADLRKKNNKIIQMSNLNKELLQDKKSNKQATLRNGNMPGKGRKKIGGRFNK